MVILRGWADIVLMSKRTWVYRLMMVGPALTVGYIGLEARSGQASFVTPHYSYELNRRILAYREPLHQMQVHNLRTGKPANMDSVRTVAKFWIKEHKAGRLKELPTEYRGDSIREGVKGQIKLAAQKLISELFRSAESVKDENPRLALQDLHLALQVSAIIRRSDLFSMGYFGTREKVILDEMVEMTPSLNKQDLTYVQTILSQVSTDELQLEDNLRLATHLDQWASMNEPKVAFDVAVTSNEGSEVQASVVRHLVDADQDWLSAGRHFATTTLKTKNIALKRAKKAALERSRALNESK